MAPEFCANVSLALKNRSPEAIDAWKEKLRQTNLGKRRDKSAKVNSNNIEK